MTPPLEFVGSLQNQPSLEIRPPPPSYHPDPFRPESTASMPTSIGDTRPTRDSTSSNSNATTIGRERAKSYVGSTFKPGGPYQRTEYPRQIRWSRAPGPSSRARTLGPHTGAAHWGHTLGLSSRARTLGPHAGTTRCSCREGGWGSKNVQGWSAAPFPEKLWWGGGGVKFFCHQKNLSENILSVKFNCIQFSWPNGVGGYMRGVK